MDMEKVTELLRENGLKVTPQRLAVYEVLYGMKDHPTVEMIYNKLHPKYPTMSLATVYKALEVLVQVGLVQQINVGEESFRYDAVISSHPHVRCTKCGRVDDVFDVDDSAIMRSVAEKTSYKLTGRQLYFFGVCSECSA